MKILSTIPEMRAACTNLRRAEANGSLLGLVPTMGALHEGHLSLTRACRERCAITTVSIFVNPTQFGPNEDLALYPRTFDDDCRQLEVEGVDLLFAPAVEEMYPRGEPRTSIEVEGIGDRLDGRSRPGHFRAVATVVAKLFGIVTPDVAFFGQKDAAQVAVLRAMVEDLNFTTQILVCPTVRERDGVALSSRNRYLSTTERVEARMLWAALGQVQASVDRGTTNAAELSRMLRERILSSSGARLEYAEVVNPETLEAIDSTERGALVAVAAWIGTTRLIDNIVVPASAAKVEG